MSDCGVLKLGIFPPFPGLHLSGLVSGGGRLSCISRLFQQSGPRPVPPYRSFLKYICLRNVTHRQSCNQRGRSVGGEAQSVEVQIRIAQVVA